MRVTAIIAAGGAGTRLGASMPKQLLDIGGRTMLARSIGAFDAHPGVSDLVVVLPRSLSSDAAGLPATTRRLRVVTGGGRRQDSVANAFDAVDADTDVVLIHDAARPFVTADVIARTIDAAARYGAAIAAVEASDTIKRVQRSGEDGIITETIPRETIFLAQTPQGFTRRVLAEAVALGRTGVEATDEAMLAERAGHPVHVVRGDAGNVKITTEHDLDVARRRVGDPRGLVAAARIGTGYDLHRMVERRPLVLGGVTVPFERGALGHSDADVICHAITDAILGAAGLGDIGRHFPDTDPAWKDASSLDLLARATRLLADAGFEVGNVDVSVVLERPKIKNYIDDMRGRVAQALGIEPSGVGIKGKTNEGVDAVGRGEAIAAHAVALIRSRVTA